MRTRLEFDLRTGEWHYLRVAVMFSGGKDSCYAVWLTLHQAWEVARLVSVKPASDESMMFHYPNIDWVGLQAQSMGLEHTMISLGSNEMHELEDLLRRVKDRDKLDGLVTGAVASDYQKSRFDYVCEKVGLRCFSPLWHKSSETIVDDLVACGFRIVMAAVAASGLDETWLGKLLSNDDWDRLKMISRKFGLHLAGEGGEYETFVVDAPQFNKSIAIMESEKVWRGQSGYMRIKKASFA